MKLLRFAAIALLSTIPMVACDDDTTTTPPAVVVIVGTISGTVSVEGTGLAGVTVNLVGAASQSATTARAVPFRSPTFLLERTAYRSAAAPPT